MIKNKEQQNKTEYPGYRKGLAGSSIGLLTSLGKRKKMAYRNYLSEMREVRINSEREVNKS